MVRAYANDARAPGAMLLQVASISVLAFNIMGHGWCGEGGVAIPLHHGYAHIRFRGGVARGMRL